MVVITVVIFIIMRAQRKTRLSKSPILFLLPCDDVHFLTVLVQTIHWAKEEDDRFVQCW